MTTNSGEKLIEVAVIQGKAKIANLVVDLVQTTFDKALIEDVFVNVEGLREAVENEIETMVEYWAE
jgi:hypothetical protein